MLSVIVLNLIMLSVIILNVVMVSVILLNVIMLSIILLSASMLIFVMLSILVSYLFNFLSGMTILDLGCGWGSVTLYVAKKFPKIQVVSLSNSSTQREFIESEARVRGLKNVKVFTGDVAVFDDDEFKSKFDRIISIGKLVRFFIMYDNDFRLIIDIYF